MHLPGSCPTAPRNRFVFPYGFLSNTVQEGPFPISGHCAWHVLTEVVVHTFPGIQFRKLPQIGDLFGTNLWTFPQGGQNAIGGHLKGPVWHQAITTTGVETWGGGSQDGGPLLIGIQNGNQLQTNHSWDPYSVNAILRRSVMVA